MPSSEQLKSQLESEIAKCMKEFQDLGYTFNNPDSVLSVLNLRDDEKLSTQVENVHRIAVQYAASLIPIDVKIFGIMSKIRPASAGHIAQKNLLMQGLEILRPLMDFGSQSKLNFGIDPAQFNLTDRLIREIKKLLSGEESELFQPVYRKSGQRQFAFTEAENKFRALTHEKRLRASGKSPGEAQALVCHAFGAPWSTIAGWKKQCEKSLGSIFVANELERAQRKLPPEMLEKYINWNLAVDGEAYKRKVRPFETELFHSHLKNDMQTANNSES